MSFPVKFTYPYRKHDRHGVLRDKRHCVLIPRLFCRWRGATQGSPPAPLGCCCCLIFLFRLVCLAFPITEKKVVQETHFCQDGQGVQEQKVDGSTKLLNPNCEVSKDGRREIRSPFKVLSEALMTDCGSP